MDIPAWSRPLALTWVLALSLILYHRMGRDKRASRTRRVRVPERTLLTLALLGGAPGGWIAMHRFRHKTRHLRFRLILPSFALIWTGLVLYLWVTGTDALPL